MTQVDVFRLTLTSNWVVAVEIPVTRDTFFTESAMYLVLTFTEVSLSHSATPTQRVARDFLGTIWITVTG